ncbi:DUF551 domain-containing protein [Citrobacter sp. Ce105]|uniref:DUF551 domain-containing protein n=1 Tax=Citrobacter sp. Ce105 TaxID=2985041 RepID=UPI0025772C57|nr:DUF551 domain-containing protein [Citrobacter sp. Ce105]MDM3290187.1 DUF551 domain-containing protein [Citrobacter sp. Ce105]
MTTNNHPANGPVSLDRLHQISEILSKAAAQSDGGSLGYAMADAVKVIDEVLNTEPVAYMTYKGYLLHAADPKLAEYSDPTPLYDAPPAPQPALVAMKDHQIRELVNEIRDIAVEYHGTQQLRERIARTVRAAMLQAGKPPVAPDGWIPVSERMPEGSEEVLCTKEFDGPGDWRKKVGYWHEGKWVVYGASWTPTYWMPLPAAPQQEMKSV